MSDRVAIIGGSTVGRDHFPTPSQDWPFGGTFPDPGTFWPYTVPLGAACEWFYKIRKWRLELDVSYGIKDPPTDPPAPEPTYTPYSGNQALTMERRAIIPGGEDIAYRDAERESDLLIAGAYNHQWVEAGSGYDPLDSNVTVTDYSASFGGGEGFNAEFLLAFETRYFYVDSDERFGQQLVVSFAFNYGGGSATARTLFGGGTERLVGEFFVGSSAPGSDVPLPLYSDAITTQKIIIYSISITFTPIEYWPYATKAGLPVYDTTTGAQLRDPLS